MNVTQYTGSQTGGLSDTGRGSSPSIWADCPWMEVQAGIKDGIIFFDDFLRFPFAAGTQTTEIGFGDGYKVYNTGSGTVIRDSMPHASNGTQIGGAISMLCDTAGDQSALALAQAPFSFAASAKKLWFEARIATTSIATNMTHIFCGLGNVGDVALGAAIPLADADATGTAVALAGFTRLEDGLGVLNASYTDEAAVYTHAETGVGAIAANTWVKVGFTFDVSKGANCLEFYVNGVRGTTPVSAATIAALTHLDASGLGPVFAQFADSGGTANYAYLDWWRCAQLLA